MADEGSLTDGGYPRALTPLERELISWVLPAESPGYAALRTMILDGFLVLGEGRRGKGEILAGTPGTKPDISAPLPPVFAYGVIETSDDAIYVTVRELLEGQVSIELVAGKSDELPGRVIESRRWTYSGWAPGRTCPQCGRPPRETGIHTMKQKRFVLACCRSDKRMWLHDADAMVNLLIPATNFYNELMLHKNIRDPKIALNHNLLFEQLDSYSDADIVRSFATYNTLKKRVNVEGGFVIPPEPVKPLAERIAAIFKKQ